MKIRYNEDPEIVASVKEGLKRTGGYCPCRLERTEENKCMCKEFRDQIKDPEFEGYCHCLLYYKEKEFSKKWGRRAMRGVPVFCTIIDPRGSTPVPGSPEADPPSFCAC